MPLFAMNPFHHFVLVAREFDAAKHFDTHPDFVHRSYNRPRIDQLKKGFMQDVDTEEIAVSA